MLPNVRPVSDSRFYVFDKNGFVLAFTRQYAFRCFLFGFRGALRAHLRTNVLRALSPVCTVSVIDAFTFASSVELLPDSVSGKVSDRFSRRRFQSKQFRRLGAKSSYPAARRHFPIFPSLARSIEDVDVNVLFAAAPKLRRFWQKKRENNKNPIVNTIS